MPFVKWPGMSCQFPSGFAPGSATCRRRAVLLLATATVLLTLSPAARADEPPNPPPPWDPAWAHAPSRPPLRWDPAWTQANAWDYTLAPVGLTTLGLETIFLQGKSEPPRWFGPVLFDTAVRNVFHGNNQSVRADAANVSWGFWFSLVGYPLVVDVPYAWARFGKDVAWDLFWQDATALSLSAATDFALRDIIARVRPIETECIDQGGTSCLNGPESTRSFPSGHVSETTTATALICTQHLTLHLYGAPWDALTCASVVAADMTVAALRLVADDHWATDVLGGAALGIAFGWGVPFLMHLRGHSKPARADNGLPVLVAPVPIAVNRGGGMGLAGLF
jgi:membrane-associated phospholipid phosphatase